MARKKTDAKTHRLEPRFHNILICKKNDCRPFLEVLVEEPENISRQNLGILVGIFQIDDRSEDSSYVVNYLISIIKKEYFSRANRGPVENFESALHKANLALAKLATHENIGWIGKINAICAVIEKNNLLLSQTGNASAFLLRGATLTEITEAPLEKIDSNPLKTFQDVISGKIEKDDKLLFTTKELFDIFSLEEIKKSALKFSRENFIQFLNTALVNELDQIAALVIDISEKEAEIIKLPHTKKIEDTNVFSQTAFQKELSPEMLEKAKIKEEAAMKERQAMILELKEDAKDFIDKKTGHIYIKEPHDFQSENSPQKTPLDFSAFKEKSFKLASLGAEFLAGAKNKTKNLAISFWQKNHAKISQIKLRKKIPSLQGQSAMPERLAETAIKISPTEKARKIYAKLDLNKRSELMLKTAKIGAVWLREKTADGLVLLLRKPAGLTLDSIAFLKNKWRNGAHRTASEPAQADVKSYPWENIPAPRRETKTTPLKISAAFLEKTARIKKAIKPKKILPDFSRLKQITEKLDRKQKISAFLVIMLLLVVPYWIARWEDKPEEKPPVIKETRAIALPLEKDLNVTRVEKLNMIYAGNSAKITNLNDKFFAQTETEIIDLENKKTFPVSSDFQRPEAFFGMDDLNLLFLVKNNQIASLSPTTGKLQNNTLNFSEDGKIVDVKTYLTYIYLLDAHNRQIYRAPRAEGGFGEKTTWLKEALNLSDAKSLAINENIFVSDGKNILKLFRGKKLDFSIESTATPIIPDKLYAQNSDTSLYVLDATNARIIKLDANGKILAQYYNTDLRNATDFSVSEKNNLIYLSDKDGVKSFEMK